MTSRGGQIMISPPPLPIQPIEAKSRYFSLSALVSIWGQPLVGRCHIIAMTYMLRNASDIHASELPRNCFEHTCFGIASELLRTCMLRTYMLPSGYFVRADSRATDTDTDKEILRWGYKNVLGGRPQGQKHRPQTPTK